MLCYSQNRCSFPASLPFAVIAAIVACSGLACDRDDDAAASARGGEERKQDAIAVTVTPAIVAPVQRSVEITGTLFGDEEATVSAKVPGRIVSILHDVGDRTAAGQPLAQIDKTDYELAVAQKQMAMQASLAKLGLSELPRRIVRSQQGPDRRARPPADRQRRSKIQPRPAAFRARIRR